MKEKKNVKETPEGIIIEIHVIPKASSNAIVGWEGDKLKVRIAAVPEKGKVNKELIHFLAKRFGCAASQIEFLRGTKSRYKTLIIKDLNLYDRIIDSV